MAPHRHPLLIAHRGESRDAPENTLAAIRLAWSRGAAAVELDVRLTGDGAVVVVHDPDLRRTGGASLVVARATAAELRALDVGRWKDPSWAGERVPLLGEVLATVPSHGRLFIEIKSGPETAAALEREVRACGLQSHQILLMSFDPATVGAAARALPDCEACLLRTARDWTRARGIDAAIEEARARGCTALDVEYDRRLDRDVVDAVHAAGMRLYVWTINRPAVAARLLAAGIDGVTTDRCAWMAAQVGNRGDERES